MTRPAFIATGVYAIDSEPGPEPRQDRGGDLYAVVPVHLVSNPMQGLPLKMELAFTDYDLARKMADRPGWPIQITIEAGIA
jgi:hypothetical protein